MSMDIIARAMAASGGSGSGITADDIAFDNSGTYIDGSIGKAVKDNYYAAKDLGGGKLVGANVQLVFNDDGTVSWESL